MKCPFLSKKMRLSLVLIFLAADFGMIFLNRNTWHDTALIAIGLLVGCSATLFLLNVFIDDKETKK